MACPLYAVCFFLNGIIIATQPVAPGLGRMLWILFTANPNPNVSRESLCKPQKERERERRASRLSVLTMSFLGRPLAISLAALRTSLSFENSLR